MSDRNKSIEEINKQVATAKDIAGPEAVGTKISPEQQEAIQKLGEFFIKEYFANLHPADKGKKTNPIEVLVRSAIKHVINVQGNNATPETVAAGIYELLHIGDNISFFITEIKADKVMHALKRHRSKNVL